MMKSTFKRLLPVALAMVAASAVTVPAYAQVQVHVGFGPFDVRFAPDAPPPMRQEYQTPRPGPDHIWISGYWDRDGDRWAWRQGRWERPERRDIRWMAPHYRSEGGGYRYEPGHWSNQKMVEGEGYRRARAEHLRTHGRGPGKGQEFNHD